VFLAAVGLTSGLLAACGGDDEAVPESSSSAAAGAASGSQDLLVSQELDVLDQPIAYPKKKPAQVSSTLLALEPGQETGWLRHRVPTYVYVMEGTLTVEYDAGVIKEYPAGTAYLDAEDIWHNGTNKSDGTARLLIVYMGAEGKKNVVNRTP
jgi:quercetin dioxygenase-like cupin family protein